MEKKVSSQQGRGGYLEALLNGCPDAILAIDAEGTITFANQEACKLTEREIYELVGESIVVVYEDLEAARETNRKLYLSGGLIHDHESKARTKAGKIIPVRISASFLRDSAGNYTGAVGYFQKYRPWSAAEAQVKTYAEKLEVELAEWKGLSAPVFELYPGLAVAVVVGRLDGGRFENITRNLLDHVKAMKTKVVLIDLSAALVADGGVAGQLVKTMRMAHLLGTQCVLAGMQSSLAEDMESLVPDVSSVWSFCCVNNALEAALEWIGLEIRQKG